MAGLTEGTFWEDEIRQIETTDPVMGGVPNVATGAGMSNIPHWQLARRTQWLRQQLGGFSAVVNYTANGAILETNAGKHLKWDGISPGLLALPPLSAVEEGASFYLLAAGAAVTLTPNGADPIQGSDGVALASVALLRGDDVRITRGFSEWNITGGSFSLRRAGQFGASLAQNGWQRLPSGLILQWVYNVQTITAGNASAAVIFPITFPTAVLNIQAVHVGSVNDVTVMIDSTSLTTSSLRWKSSWTGSQAHYFSLIGY